MKPFFVLRLFPQNKVCKTHNEEQQKKKREICLIKENAKERDSADIVRLGKPTLNQGIV